MNNSIINLRYSIIALLLIVLSGVGAYASTPWTVNPSDYRYDMSLYLDFEFADGKMDYSKYEVAVFSGNQCRGVAELLSVDQDNVCLYLRARSNSESGEKLTYKYYNKETEEILPVYGVELDFVANSRVGYPSEPSVVTIYNYHEVTLTAGVGGTIDKESAPIKEGTQITVTATPAEGYSFSKWSDGVTDNPRTLTVTAPVTLEAQFTVNKYVLTYVVDGEEYRTYDIDYGTAITPEEEPTKEGNTFSGWDNVPATMPAQDVTVSGTFTVNKYTLTVYLNNEIFYSVKLDYGAEVVIPEVVVPDGSTFDGWTSEVPETMPAHDVEIHGTYSSTSSVTQIAIEADDVVTVYSLDGICIYRNAPWHIVQTQLSSGCYIINGSKYLINK